jgi:predicted nucleic acid-binding protein
MSVRYNVKADVVDLRNDYPTDNDIFLVDTNVWYWQTYTKASLSASPYQTNHYPSYLLAALNAGSTLVYCGLSLSELAHLIEGTERKIFNQNIKSKPYRHNYPNQRQKVVEEIQDAWEQVTSIAVCADIIVNESTTDKALQRLETQLLDGYDLLILEAMEKANISKVITDDGDYVTVPNITVFTANRNVINAAQGSGKLKQR